MLARFEQKKKVKKNETKQHNAQCWRLANLKTNKKRERKKERET